MYIDVVAVLYDMAEKKKKVFVGIEETMKRRKKNPAKRIRKVEKRTIKKRLHIVL